MTAARRTRSTLAGASLGLILVAAVSLFVSGCAPSLEMPVPVPTTTPPAHAAPIFATDEEALAAATEAYEKYLALSDLIAAEGGVNPERIGEITSGQAFGIEMKSFGQFREARARLIGATAFDSATLQKFISEDDSSASISFYVCDDVTEVDVLNDEGTSLVSSERQPRSPFEVTVLVRQNTPAVISAKYFWTGASFC